MKKRWILVGILIIVMALTAGVLFLKQNKKDTSDGIKFKEEYEKYNKQTTENDEVYPTVNVNKKNIMYYATSREIIDILKKGTGVIYFGSPSDPWSRNAVNVLLQASESTALNRIYYLDLTKKQDYYEASNKKVTKVKEGSKDYYEIVDLLKDNLTNYLVNDGEYTIDTGVKRIFMPFVVFVQNGKIISTREGTTNSHMNNGNGYVALSEKEEEELFNYYVDKMTIVTDSSCDDTC